MTNLKDILIHVYIETAKAKRSCKGKRKHDSRIIEKGKKCMRVKSGRFLSSTYCFECAKEMLSSASKKINALQNDLKN